MLSCKDILTIDLIENKVYSNFTIQYHETKVYNTKAIKCKQIVS